MLTAIIVAGGSGRRMGFDKTFALLAGEAVLVHSLRAFERAEGVANIIVVGREERLSEIEALIRAQRFGKVSDVVAGGARRQDSVRHGLEKVSANVEYVAVHDAARPFVRPETIAQVFAAARTHGGAACAAPVSDTLKRADREGCVAGGVDRENLFAVQTPQIFRRDLLLEAYRQIFAANLEITDEISAVEHAGGKVLLVPNDFPNFKITYPADLAFAERLLKQQTPR
ncbi:MAG TPA: 2-C-methyl-D-erythritol 4-phosphate cytidylyltransferase [Chthoniobacterales bacterium]